MGLALQAGLIRAANSRKQTDFPLTVIRRIMEYLCEYNG